MSKRLGLCVVALLVSLTLAGCGGEESSKSSPKPTAAASPSAPPGLDATGPKRPTKQADTLDSALEYGSYFALLVQYAIETRDSRVVSAEAFDQAGCTSCTNVAKQVEDLKSTGWWQIGDPVKLGKLRAVPMQGGVRVQGSLAFPRVQDVKLSGEVGGTSTAVGYRYHVDLWWDEKKATWQVLDFLYQKRN